jgi:hypothetical protein
MAIQDHAGERGSEGRLPLNWRAPSSLLQASHFQHSRNVLCLERFRSLEMTNFLIGDNAQLGPV